VVPAEWRRAYGPCQHTLMFLVSSKMIMDNVSLGHDLCFFNPTCPLAVKVLSQNIESNRVRTPLEWRTGDGTPPTETGPWWSPPRIF